MIPKASVQMDVLLREFYDPERFLACCRECDLCGKQWSCPPLQPNISSRLHSFTTADIYITGVEVPAMTPLSESERLLLPYRREMERRLLALEQQEGGMVACTIGRCSLCDVCTRPYGKPCRHPDLVRPSLEALGFNVCEILDKLCNIKLLWSSSAYLPATIQLAGAHFH